MNVLPGAEPFAHDGTRTGVLVCHGFTGSPQSMLPLAKRCAAEGFTVRLPRLPGHGTHWKDLNRTRWTDWWSAVDDAYTELAQRCDHIVAVGMSMGGTLATLAAQQHPHGIGGLVLINPAYVMRDIRLKALPVLQHVVPSIASIAGDIKKPGVSELAYERTPLRALQSQRRMWEQVTRDLPQITQPVLLLHSPDDHVVPPECSALLLARVSSADKTEVLLHDSYHVATLDNDAQLIEDETVQFIQRVTAASS
ncbi:alpha/beta hydrolase [Flexivirga oryzae]|uniref:Carboxylesterase n=1 Tax=Flexivirga oryzae TaxID=1794944 RepID=A0A839N6A4_9MICO|nr:alpha/beta fold hydrolase [Flexivirga oryzae]MBB2892299.1 carboxylesterase [Flexivirga oryzae]